MRALGERWEELLTYLTESGVEEEMGHRGYSVFHTILTYMDHTGAAKVSFDELASASKLTRGQVASEVAALEKMGQITRTQARFAPSVFRATAWDERPWERIVNGERFLR